MQISIAGGSSLQHPRRQSKRRFIKALKIFFVCCLNERGSSSKPAFNWTIIRWHSVFHCANYTSQCINESSDQQHNNIRPLQWSSSSLIRQLINIFSKFSLETNINNLPQNVSSQRNMKTSGNAEGQATTLLHAFLLNFHI